MNQSDLRRIIKEEISLIVNDMLVNMRIIHEAMVPTYRDDYYEIGETNYMVIAQDDVTDDKLVLFAELHEENNYHTYSYFFVVFDRMVVNKTSRIYTRDRAAKYLPKEIKPTVIPTVLRMTKSLVNRIKPNVIKRQTIEPLTDEGMVRYEIISKMLQNELGYELINQGRDDENNHIWTFMKDGKTINMDENTISSYYIPSATKHREILERAHENLLNEIKKNPLKLD